MIIYGDKVVLRPIEGEDAELLRKMINSPDIESSVVGFSFPVSKLQQETWMKNLGNRNDVFRAMIDVNGIAIGEAMLTDIDYKNGTAEIHIKIADKKNRGCGYGKDTITTLTDYAFDELRLHCVYCHIREDNKASQSLFVSCGYLFEGNMRSRMFKSGKYYDLKAYSKINEDA